MSRHIKGRPSAERVEREKVEGQICRIIYKELDSDGYWRLGAEPLCDALLARGAVDTNVIRGRDYQLDVIERALQRLEESGRVIFTVSDGVCELSLAEKRLQRIAATSRQRKQKQLNRERRARRARERSQRPRNFQLPAA